MNSNDGFPFLDGGALDSGRSFNVEAFAAAFGGVALSRLRSGTVLYSQGEPADSMYYLQDGQVQITVVSSQGKEGILGVLGPGDLCGEGSLLGNRNRVATVACIADSLVARIERANAIRAIRENTAIAGFFLAFALRRVVDLRENLISQLFDTSEKRLARTLVVLANQGRNGAPNNVIRNIDQEGLAQMIGTTRSRVNLFMNRFRRLRYIDYDGEIIVVFPSLSNVALCDERFGESDDGLAMAC
ncbi:MAG TPA: Crp/Fnr family transcriptional regulator [Xanthobacteraceae bacterium]|nr:Crp/Fnr family transcriptional regulator [Xanthobacteraceae bacterium]